MASSSNLSVQKRFTYDVFLSFRGEDTRKNIVDHLYHALMDKGIYTYKDDEKIQIGKRISDDLIKSIEDSKFYIIVFSKNYASSSWCLEELVKIMECQKMTEHTAYPLFYDVEPTEVRKQSGAFGEAFAKYENEEAAGKWSEALKEAADLAGWELINTLDGHQARFIKKIVQEISLELLSINFGFDEKLVGMETRVKDVVSSLEVCIDEVRMIGIKGMGGAGKTTTTRAVFDHLSHSKDFDATSFVKNVREVSNGSDGLKKLQEQVLFDTLNVQVTLHNVDDGKDMMNKRMRGKKVLLVLDDVDHIEQLKALAGERKWFKSGSRILITTRDEQVLKAHKLVDVIRDIALLSHQEATSLFSRYAFGRENPLQGYEALSENVVRYAAGLPLTVTLLGSFLCGKDRVEWVDAIERLEKIPLKETMEKLELSYTSLEDEYKEIFLDIACILKGETKEDAIRILESCGFHARIGLKVLEQRSLITISSLKFDFVKMCYHEVLGMHDHIEEMGKNIVRREHPDEPNKHSRLWIKEEIEDILDNDMGTEATRCLKLKTARGNPRIVMKGLGIMKKLQYLEVDLAFYKFKMKKLQFLEVKFSYYKSTLPDSLKYLKCTNYPFLYLPKTFQANNLVGLEMYDSRMVQLWKKGEKKVLKNFMPVCCQNLKYLHISHSKLITFDLELTPKLETLYLDNCADFAKLHVSVTCPNLKFLKLSGSRLRSLDLELIPNLEMLDLAECQELVDINAPVGCLKRVVFLNLSGCLRYTYFVSLRRSKSKVSRSLASLDLDGESLDLCPLNPNSNLPKLRFHCRYEEDLPSSVGNIEKLISLIGLCACTDLKKFSDIICSLQCLKKPTLRCNIPEFPKDLGQLECLEELHLSSTMIKHLPDSICMLKHLKSLTVGCDLLEKLPDDLGRLECLEKLHLSSRKIQYLPDSICMLKHLKRLDVGYCFCIGKLSEDIGQLESLEELDLWGTKIKHLPDSICMLKHLKFLNLHRCVLLEKLPEDLGRLECLKELIIVDSGISHLPQSIFGLKGLFISASSELLQLYDFPSEIEVIAWD